MTIETGYQYIIKQFQWRLRLKSSRHWKRKYCPHCCETVSKSTYYSHLLQSQSQIYMYMHIHDMHIHELLFESYYRIIHVHLVDIELFLELATLLAQKFPEVKVSLSTVKRARHELGWVARTGL